MAHVRKDTLVAPPEWWKHLRGFNKRRLNKAERRAGRVSLESEVEEGPLGLGLHNDPEKMRWMREHDGEAVIPAGIYCYDKVNCPYWDKAEHEAEQCNGFCWFLGTGDWDEGGGELWDQCKCCGVREEIVPEGTIPVVDEKEVGSETGTQDVRAGGVESTDVSGDSH